MPLCRERLHGELAYRAGDVRHEHLVARGDDGTVVGHAWLTLPLHDNLHIGQLELTVHLKYRRLGIGHALYQHVTDRLRELGRQRVIGRTTEPLASADPPTPGRAFATAVGAEPVLEEHRHRLELPPASTDAWAMLRSQVQQSATAYQVVTWRNRTPEPLLADAAYLVRRLATDAPHGELDWRPGEVDLARVRQTEDGLAATRTHTYLAGAVHTPSGRLVGLTMLARPHTVPDQCSQWITIVAPPHRGHRLGLLLKLANLAHIRAHEPQLRTVDTWTAATNHHMRRINQQLGFQPVDRWVVWQAQV